MRRRLLVAVFVLSGAAGLIYEVLWSRYLGLFVGHSAYAQIIVLVIFLGGMSAGAHLIGRRSNKLQSPLLWYAAVELAVGIIALVFHDSFVALTGWAYASVFPALSGPALLLTKWILAGALLLPQSVLLGATFPLMSAGLIRLAGEEQTPGRLLSLLYFANSIGAAAGVLIAGFFLIPAVGLPGTLIIAALSNATAAGVVFLIARAHGREIATRQSPSGSFLFTPEVVPTLPRDDRVMLLTVTFGTAIASFIYEIAWIRMLSLVLGSATHSFELMLSAFILGLALGALWIRTRADSLANPIRFLGHVQWIMGMLAVATLPLYIQSFDWTATLLGTVQQNASGYRVFAVFRYVVAALIMLPATFCAGMTLPLITRLLMRGGGGERAIGTVYAVNTLGSIVGVIFAGLLLMPLLGLKVLLISGAVVDIALGVWLVARSGPQRPETVITPAPSLAIPVTVTAAAILVVAIFSPFDLLRLTSGVYRHGVVEKDPLYSFPFYKDGRTATVSVRRGNSDGFVTLSTNGKPDASMDREWVTPDSGSDERRQLSRDIATQLLLPTITLAHAPYARNAAVIGQGSGMTSHVLLGSPWIKNVATIEIEPEMINASRVFRPANRRVFDDKRSTFVIDDAKSYFASAGKKFDVIVSEPSNPWVSGVSGLFTQEFYHRVKLELAPEGVFGQWLHLYELNDSLASSVLAAIDTVFPAYEVFYTSNTDILIVAANHPLRSPLWGVVAYSGIAEDFRHVVPIGNETFESLRLGNRVVLHPYLLAHAEPNSDFYPALDLNAERMRFMHQTADGYTSLTEGRFDVVAALTNRRADFGTLGLTVTPEVPRPLALALGARLRAMRTLPATETAAAPRDEDLRNAMYRADELDRVIATGNAPADWKAWMASVMDVYSDIHGGTAGVADSAFFKRVRDFARRAGAPLEARAALDFLHGIASWNWVEAAIASTVIMAAEDPNAWIPDLVARNGAAVAYIKLQDTAGARKVLKFYGTRTSEDRFREEIIATYLIYSDAALRKKMGWQ
jgi:spermidine synthase